MKDPTREEMLAVLRQAFGCYDKVDEAYEFDKEGAIYWFANDWHGGQTSNLYSALSTSPFNPGPACTGPEPSSLEKMMYDELEAAFCEPADLE